MQETFIKFNKIFGHFLVTIDLLENLLTKTTRKVYQELAKMSLNQKEKTLLTTYEQLENKLGYCRNTIRNSLLELEKAHLIYRGKTVGIDSLYIEMNQEFFITKIEKFYV